MLGIHQDSRLLDVIIRCSTQRAQRRRGFATRIVVSLRVVSLRAVQSEYLYRSAGLLPSHSISLLQKLNRPLQTAFKADVCPCMPISSPIDSIRELEFSWSQVRRDDMFSRLNANDEPLSHSVALFDGITVRTMTEFSDSAINHSENSGTNQTDENGQISGTGDLSGAGAQFWSRLVEQRREDRVDFRTTGHAYVLGPSGFTPIEQPVRIWTVDVSTTGALVRTYSPITSQRLLIELVMPQLAGSLIEAKVVRRLQDVARYLDGKDQASYLYGLRFSRIIKKSLMSEPPKPVELPHPPTAEVISIPVAQSRAKRAIAKIRSLIPLLSVFGIVAIYAAMEICFE